MDNILIIGKGSISFKHKNIIKKTFIKSNITHISSRNFFLKYKEFKNKKYKITIIANDSTAHLKVLKIIASNSALIFIEKPISNNYKKIENLSQTKFYKRYKSKIWTGYNLIYSKLLKKIKKIIDDKQYGKLISVRCAVGHNVKYWRKKNIKESVSVNKNLGGGVLNELSHEISYLIYLLGDIEVIQAHSLKSYFKNIDVEDSSFVLFKNKNKVLITLAMDFYRDDKFRECQFIFEKGTMFVNFINGIITFKSNTKNFIMMNYKKDLEQTYNTQWKFLKKVVNNKIRNNDNLKNSILTLKIINEIKKF